VGASEWVYANRRIATSRSSSLMGHAPGSRLDREHYEIGLWAVAALSVQPIFRAISGGFLFSSNGR
jgi:hypothetical protein